MIILASTENDVFTVLVAFGALLVVAILLILGAAAIVRGLDRREAKNKVGNWLKGSRPDGVGDLRVDDLPDIPMSTLVDDRGIRTALRTWSGLGSTTSAGPGRSEPPSQPTGAS